MVTGAMFSAPPDARLNRLCTFTKILTDTACTVAIESDTFGLLIFDRARAENLARDYFLTV